MASEKLRAAVYTLGCRVNQYESDAISEILIKDGFEIVPFDDGCDIAIINTCTVTAESARKSRQFIRRAQSFSENGYAVPVVVTGCFSQVSPEQVPDSDGITYILGTADKEKIPSIAKVLIEKSRSSLHEKVEMVSDVNESPYDSLVLTSPLRTRSYIKIEDGCENRCSYCIIPKARGKVRSKAEDIVVEEAKQLISRGSKELILTGIETASYSRDIYPHEPYGYRLAKLLERIDSLEGIERIGLGSLEPTVLRTDFISIAGNLKHLLPHLHLSIQSGSTAVLNRMRRKYTAERAYECISAIREAIPDITFSADVITGFPGETEEEFAETIEYVKKIRFLHLHIFPYSEREGTAAAEMPNQVDGGTRHDRARRLEAVQKKIKAELLDDYTSSHSNASSPIYLLIEKNPENHITGHSEHFVECDIETNGKHLEVGEIVPCILNGHDGDIVFGNIL